MVKHISVTHGIHLKSQAEAIAMNWKDTVKKQAWSCGFCVKTFVTFRDRLNHIAAQHFERGQTIDEWDTTKVIEGLLRQSGMIKAWTEKVASLPIWEVDNIIWGRDVITSLQHDLEVGPDNDKSAVNLAEAAYTACRLNWAMEAQRALAEVKSSQTFVATDFSPNQFQASLVPAPGSESDHHESLSATQIYNEISSSGPANARGTISHQPADHLLSNEKEDPNTREEIETTSIMSLEAPSLMSDTTLPSSVPAEDAAEEFAVLLFHDEIMQPLIIEASKKVEIKRLKRNFAKLLIIYADDLREEATQVLKKAAVELVRKRVQYITSCIWDSKDKRTQAMDRLLAQTSKREDRLTLYLQNLVPEDSYLSPVPVMESMQEKSEDEGCNEDFEPPEPMSNVNFTHVKNFMTQSAAYADLRRNFRDFLVAKSKSMQQPPSRQSFLDSPIESPSHDLQRAIEDATESDICVSDSEDPLESRAIGSTSFHINSKCYPFVLRIFGTFVDWILSTAEFLELREKPLDNGMKRARWQCVRLLKTAAPATKH